MLPVTVDVGSLLLCESLTQPLKTPSHSIFTAGVSARVGVLLPRSISLCKGRLDFRNLEELSNDNGFHLRSRLCPMERVTREARVATA